MSQIQEVSILDESKIVSPSMPNSSSKETATPTRAWLIYACAAFFYLYEYALRASPGVMTHHLMRDLGMTSTGLGVLTAFYYYAYVPLQVPCGIIVDWLGPKRVVSVSALLCVVGCLLFGSAQSLYVAQLGRFVIGAASACAYISCTKVVAEWFHPRKFVMIASVTMMMGTLGGTFGGFPFAVLINHFGWRVSMFIAAAIGLAIALAAWTIIKDRDDQLISPTHEPNHPDLTLMQSLKIVISQTQIWLVGLYGFFMYVPLSAFAELWGVPYLMGAYNINNELASIFASATLFIGMGIGCPIAAYISDRTQSRKRVMSGAALSSLVLFTILVYYPLPSFWMLPTLIFLAGLCCGGQILYFAVARDCTPVHLAGTAIGFTNGLLMCSGVVYQPVLGFLLDLAWDGTMASDGITRHYSVNAYKFAMGSIPIGLFAAWVVLKFVRETYQNTLAK